jgi:hypothetical protein
MSKSETDEVEEVLDDEKDDIAATTDETEDILEGKKG